MSRRRSDAFSPERVAFLRDLAKDGLSLVDIAEVAKCGKATVAKYAGDILARNRQAAAQARRAAMARLVRANAAADGPGVRDDIAGRFGFADRASLKVRVVYAKRKLGLYDAEARA